MVGDALRQLERGGVGDGARADLGQREGRRLGGQDQVAGDRQFQPAAEAADPVVAVHRVALGGGLEVPAGAEELLALGAQDGDAQLGVVAEVAEGLAHDPAGGEVDGVGLRPVQRHLQDAALAARFDRVVGHVSSLSRIRASAATAPVGVAISGLMSISITRPAWATT